MMMKPLSPVSQCPQSSFESTSAGSTSTVVIFCPFHRIRLLPNGINLMRCNVVGNQNLSPSLLLLRCHSPVISYLISAGRPSRIGQKRNLFCSASEINYIANTVDPRQYQRRSLLPLLSFASPETFHPAASHRLPSPPIAIIFPRPRSSNRTGWFSLLEGL